MTNVTINLATINSATTISGGFPDFSVNPLKDALELFKKIHSISVPDGFATVWLDSGDSIEVPLSVIVLRDALSYGGMPDYTNYSYGYCRRYDFRELATTPRPTNGTAQPVSAWDKYRDQLQPLGATSLTKPQNARRHVLLCRPNAELAAKLIELNFAIAGIAVDELSIPVGWYVTLPKGDK